MAKKNGVPKKIAGVKVPKPLRKSKVLRSMMATSVGRDVFANALTAGAGAAAAILVEQRQDVGDTAKATARKGAKAVGVAGEALQGAFSAAMDVVRRSELPTKSKRRKKASPSRRAAMH
ncbi:hypothetical protein ACMFL9_04065 (plasmid) [Sinorhizobium meliloti]